jgi:2,4-dienoyl-CoA reductase-like NADH-dependent reductase (Old Yellow Enzyme family)
MSHPKYPHLFEPIVLANTVFRNRIFASPTGPQFMTANQEPTSECAACYERKALGGAAAVCIGEGMVDSKRGRTSYNHTPLDSRRACAGIAYLTNAISRHGAVASIELQHAGCYAHSSYMDGNTIYGPVEGEYNGIPVRAMTEDVIEETIGLYARAAAYAKQCGFGMVTVHAGHGWLLTQFLSPKVNTRTDKWGGSPENRARLPVEVFKAIRKACGPNFPIEVRMSGSECFDGGYDLDTGIEIAKQFDGHADLIHVSAGQ